MTLYLSTHEPDARESKLPQWAQFIIEGLRQDVKDLKDDLDTLRTFDESDPIRVSGGLNKQSYPRGYAVNFDIGNGESIAVDLAEDGLGVHARQFGGRYNLSVRPSANNAIVLRSADS